MISDTVMRRLNWRSRAAMKLICASESQPFVLLGVNSEVRVDIGTIKGSRGDFKHLL